MGACNAGFGDCDTSRTNGCETSTTTDIANCGACGRACAARANATASCSSGACAYACAAGFGDCDGNAANGCEAPLTANANCGACGRSCPCNAGVCMTTGGLSASADQTCARLSNGTAWCWGGGYSGGATSPTRVGTSTTAAEVSAGADETCVRMSDGTAQCFSNTRTLLMLGGTFSGIASLSAEDGHRCATLSDGSARCGGLNDFGQLGDGTMNNGSPLVQDGVAGGVLMGVAQVASSSLRTCVRTTSGAVRCWGAGYHGDGSAFVTRTRPGASAMGLSGAAEIATYFRDTCARLTDGSVWCWGAFNSFGELGDGTTSARELPVRVAGLSGLAAGSGTFPALAVGNSHACVRIANGTVQCWGDLGGAGGAPRTVAGLADVVELAAGNSHICARTSNGVIWCWGANNRGQLGDGTTSTRSAPTMVRWP